MTTFANAFIRFFKSILPSPFTIAVILTFFTAILALLLTNGAADSQQPQILQIALFWEKGVWELLTFTMQMMLILVLGHIMALSKPVNRFIQSILRYCTSTAITAFLVTLLTMLVALFNWGLGLVFGAIFARKAGEYAAENQIPLNYPLIGASGYAGLMVWHGGLSGSAPLKIAETGHKWEALTGVIPASETILSMMNICASILILIAVPLAMYFLGKRSESSLVPLPAITKETGIRDATVEGAEVLDHSKLFAGLFGGLILLLCVYKAGVTIMAGKGIAFLTLNYINLLLLALGILLHGTIASFLKAAHQAITGSTGIMIQFPLYAGIMGIMKYAGLIAIFSEFFFQISTKTTFPLYTFISAGVVNFFVPSGGGQWAVQGPIIADAANRIGVAMPKAVMALAYGDQLTNMMQPFWALPLLGITGLKAKDILPYTLIMMGIGIIIFGGILLVF